MNVWGTVIQKRCPQFTLKFRAGIIFPVMFVFAQYELCVCPGPAEADVACLCGIQLSSYWINCVSSQTTWWPSELVWGSAAHFWYHSISFIRCIQVAYVLFHEYILCVVNFCVSIDLFRSGFCGEPTKSSLAVLQIKRLETPSRFIILRSEKHLIIN